jgi:hypothetical protein
LVAQYSAHNLGRNSPFLESITPIVNRHIVTASVSR